MEFCFNSVSAVCCGQLQRVKYAETQQTYCNHLMLLVTPYATAERT